jgi:hypothetical protein
MLACNRYFSPVILTLRCGFFIRTFKNCADADAAGGGLAWKLPLREGTLCGKVRKLIQNESVKCEDGINF